MIITSKLVVKTLVVLIGLGIFVRGIWLNLFPPEPLNFIDNINAFLSFLVAGVIAIIIILFIVAMFLETVGLFIKDVWNGEKQLFKPFKINFKFKKKND